MTHAIARRKEHSAAREQNREERNSNLRLSAMERSGVNSHQTILIEMGRSRVFVVPCIPAPQ
jgi:hypothetical protein